MKKKLLVISGILIILTGALLYGFPKLLKEEKLGVDLIGGFEIKYELSPLTDETIDAETVSLTANILRKRIDALGVVEPEVVILNDKQIRITLPGIKDEEGAREKLAKPLNLSFRDTSDTLLLTSSVLNENGASFSRDKDGMPAVSLSIKDNDAFYQTTKTISESEEQYIVIWTAFEDGIDSYQDEYITCGTEENDNCISIAKVAEAFSGDVVISGSFSEEEARSLATNINAGSFPAKLIEVSSGSTSAKLGAIALDKTLLAGTVGIILIMLVLIGIYRFAGLISSFAILLYAFTIFLIFYLIGGSLSLSGIAAILIGVGMAIDANVITFERIKEELFEGKTLPTALKNGTRKSLATILDANITTFIVAVILFTFGESNVIGFGLLLIISLITTIIVMVFVMRGILAIIIKTKYFDNKTNLFIGVKQDQIPKLSKNEKRKVYHFKNIDFMKKRKHFLLGSLVLIVLGVISLFVFNLNLGIDFTGGSEIIVSSESSITDDTISNDFISLNYETESITRIDDKTFKVILPDILTDAEKENAKEFFKEKYNIEPNIDVMSDAGNKEMSMSALKALIIASLMIVIYISIRFRLSYAIAAIIALLHDSFIIIALFSLFNLEINALFVAAILAIIGYSINDTIVAFDRIRENTKNHEGLDNISLVNKSLQETFLRTIYTSFTTMIPVIALIVLGSFEIINFNIALLIGLAVGTYSSIFIASAMWLFLEKKIKFNDDEEEDPVNEKVISGINS